MAQPSATEGEPLGEISPEVIGFTPLSAGKEGGKKLRLLPSAWPEDNLPPASATLLSVAPRHGLIAAASPDKLVVASTEKVRKAFEFTAGEHDVVTDFAPDATLPVQRLRHVAFSVDEDFLVTSAENGGGLDVYAVDDLLKGNAKPGAQIATNNTPVRALLPNPASEQAHYMAVILDTGRLDITDISAGKAVTVHDGAVTCASWSVKGKAFVAGFEDGTASIHLVSAMNQVKGKIPRAPDLPENNRVSAVNWMNNEELFIVYSSLESEEEAFYYYVSTNKTFSSFTFRRAPYELVFASMDGPARSSPPRYSIQRLRKWEPALDDWLIITAAHSIDVAAVTKSSEPIDPQNPIANEYLLTDISDARKPTVPRNFEETGDSALIGEALDLSSKTKVSQPSRRLEEITESPSPLPAYYLLTHEGILAAWWVVWDRSLEAGTTYPGLTCNDPTATASTAPAPQTASPATSLFGQAASNQGSAFAPPKLTTGFGSAASPAGSAAFGKPAFGSASAVGSGFGFGKPNTPGATSAASSTGGATFGAPGFGSKPTFGSPGLGGTASPFASAGSSATTNPFSAASQKPNPFAAAAANMKSGAPSPFGSFASSKDGQSGFGSLGSKPGKNSSFGSTVTVDSKASGLGSTLPSFGNTPATQSGSIFGQKATSSFPSFTSTQSGSTDLGDRGREEATPTPQHAPALKEVTGVFKGKFELGSTFKSDGSAKDDLPKPAASSGGSMFGSGFSSALGGLGGNAQAPTTPEKTNENKSALFPSTTPATAPRPFGSLFSNNRSESTTPKPAPPKPPVIPEEAPLPPDWKPAKTSKTDDEIPPLAGSPPVKVEAPSSSADELPSSPLDDEEDGDLSSGEEEEEPEDEEGEEFSDEEGQSGEDQQSGEDEQSGEEEGAEHSSPTEPFHPPRESQPSGLRGFGAAPTAPQTTFRPQHLVHSASTPLFGGTRRDPMGSSMPPAKPPTPQPVFSDLVDDEDERIRQELESEIEPSRTLAPFIARQEYAAPEAARTKTGHAAQIEIVYRDINSMIDTLGLNSRSLKAFIEWNERSERYGELDRSALEEVQDEGVDGPWFEKWALCELDELAKLEDELERDLGDGAVKRVTDKLQACIHAISDNARLLSKVNDERRRIANAKDPEKLETLRKAALPKELADQQRTLRREYAQLLTSLGKVEDELLLLRSRLVSHNAHNGHTGAVPTVESIKKTIARLTECTLERNNRIALQEARLNKARAAAVSTPTPAANSRPASSSSTALPLRPTSSSSTAATALATTPRRTRPFAPSLNGASDAGTPFATPPTHASARTRMSLQELNAVALTPEQPSATPSRSIGLFYAEKRGQGRGLGQSHASGSRSMNLSDVADWVDEGLDELREKSARRRGMGRRVVGAVKGRGVRVVRVE